MRSSAGNLSIWVLPIATGLISIGGSYLTAKVTADGAAEVARAAARTNDLEMVKLALGIVQSETKKSGVRTWAVDTLSKYTGIPIDPKVKAEMISSDALVPFASDEPLDPEQVERVIIETASKKYIADTRP